MNLGRIPAAVLVAAACAALVPWATARLTGQVLPPRPDIRSLTEDGEGLTVRLRTGRGTARFAATDGRGIRLALPDAAPAEVRARAFVRAYGAPFGLSDDTELDVRGSAVTDAVGVEHVRFAQRHRGVPVVGGEFLVHLRGARVLGANGHIVDNLPPIVAAALPAASARATAERLVARQQAEAREAGVEPGDVVRYADPQLVIVDLSLFGPATRAPRLAWFIEARATALREHLWVDAQDGTLLQHVNQLVGARQREVFNLAGASTPPASPARSEGAPAVGNADVDNAYDFSGATYDYFLSAHGRDSYDNAGAPVTSLVHYQTGYAGAFWNAEWMVFGDGYPAAEDIVGHEFTHGVIDRTAALINLRQSGALAESYADIFGETIDLLDVTASDSNDTRWDVGEDQPGSGAVRNMSDPTLHLHPGKMSDTTYFSCSEFDSTGGVDANSGVPNHAYALMADGGTYNGRTITGIGLAKAGAVEYRALTTYLTAGATFRDNFTALIQACTDLVGTNGMTSSDCTQVRLAVEAVEMNEAWPCGAVPPPPLCPNTAPPSSTTFVDGFESGAGNWTFASLAGGAYSWEVQTGGRTGVRSLYGIDPDELSVHVVSLQDDLVVPAGARLYVDHNFEFDTGAQAHDGGLVEYSTDGGSSWLDAGGFIEAGQGYNGTLSNSTGTVAYHGRQAFSSSSQGYTGTRFDLSSLAGQSLRLRFVVATDAAVGNLGWELDNVRLYQCQDAVGTNMVRNGTFGDGTTNWLTYSPNNDMVSNVTGGVFQWYRAGTQAVVFQESGIAVPIDGPLEASFDIGNSMTSRRRMSVLMHNSDFTDLSVCTFTLEPGAPLATYRMRTHTTKAWTNATISFYAANTGTDGGFYRLDNVTLEHTPGNSATRTDCIDPTAPVTGGGEPMTMLLNGNFSAGEGSNFAPWFLYPGNAIQAGVASGVMEFVRTAAGGSLTQYSNLPLAADSALGLTFRLGNSSGVRQRVTALVVDSDFSDILACTFWVPPGQALNNYAMRIATTKDWTNAAVGFYPSTAATVANPVSALQWLRLDDVVLSPTGTTPLGTECFEPGSTPVF